MFGALWSLRPRQDQISMVDAGCLAEVGETPRIRRAYSDAGIPLSSLYTGHIHTLFCEQF